MSFYIRLQRYTSYEEFHINYEKISSSLAKTSESVVKLKKVDEDRFLKVSPSSLKRRAVALIKGTDKIKGAIEKFILDNACFASQLSFHDKEQIFALNVYKNTVPSQNLQKALFKEPLVKLEIQSDAGGVLWPHPLYIKTSDSKNHFLAAPIPFCVVNGSRDLWQVSSTKTLAIFLKFYAGEQISLELTPKELIELHQLTEYLFEDANPVVSILWRETLKLLHALRAENFREDFLQDLFASLLSSFEFPSVELLTFLGTELKKATKDQQLHFFNKLKGEDPVTEFLRSYCLHEGIGVLKCAKTALSCFEKSAIKGYAPALYVLGCLYENGEGVTKSTDMAWHFHLKATSLKKRPFKSSLFILAGLYETANEQQRSKKIYDQLALQNFAPALICKRELRSLEIAAEQNYSLALYRLSVFHFEFQDFNGGIKYLERALKENDFPTPPQLKTILKYLDHNQKYRDLARKLLEKAAEGGSCEAKHNLALKLHEEGKQREAISLLIDAAKQNHPDSITKLKELNVLSESILFLCQTEENFQTFRKRFNTLIKYLEQPHILHNDKEQVHSTYISLFNSQENIPPPSAKEPKHNDELKKNITEYIVLNEHFAAFLPEEEKAKLALLPLFSEGVPETIKEIFKQQPTYKFYPFRKQSTLEWRKMAERLQENPDQFVYIKIENEGLDEKIITIPSALFPSSLLIGNEEKPVYFKKTEKKILRAFLTYLYGRYNHFLLNRKELTELEALAKRFDVPKLAQMVEAVLDTYEASSTSDTSCPNKISKVLNRLKESRQLVYLRAQDKMFRAHAVLVPYFRKAASFKITAEQELIIDVSEEVNEKVLKQFLKLQYGLEELDKLSSEENYQLFTFYHFTRAQRNDRETFEKLFETLINDTPPLENQSQKKIRSIILSDSKCVDRLLTKAIKAPGLIELFLGTKEAPFRENIVDILLSLEPEILEKCEIKRYIFDIDFYSLLYKEFRESFGHGDWHPLYTVHAKRRYNFAHLYKIYYEKNPTQHSFFAERFISYEWLLRSAAYSGLKQAKYKLVEYYENLPDKNDCKVYYTKLLALDNDPQYQYKMGLIYADSKFHNLSKYFLKLAASQGVKEAEASLKRLVIKQLIKKRAR